MTEMPTYDQTLMAELVHATHAEQAARENRRKFHGLWETAKDHKAAQARVDAAVLAVTTDYQAKVVELLDSISR